MADLEGTMEIKNIAFVPEKIKRWQWVLLIECINKFKLMGTLMGFFFILYRQKLWSVLLVQNPFPEIGNHQRKPFSQRDLRLPIQKFFCLGDIWFPHVRVICSVLFKIDGRIRIDCFLDNLHHKSRHSVNICEVMLQMNKVNGRMYWFVFMVNLSKLQHGELSRISQVERSNVVTFH